MLRGGTHEVSALDDAVLVSPDPENTSRTPTPNPLGNGNSPHLPARAAARPLVFSEDLLPPPSPNPTLYDLWHHHRKVFAPIISHEQVECGQHLAPRRLLELYQDVGAQGRVYARGIERCGSVWCCPYCAYIICAKRARELQRAIDAHVARGGEAYLFTVTVPHHAGHNLAQVRQALSETFRSVQAGEPWIRWRRRLRLVGTVRGLDATHGPNGWHPHLHIVLFVEQVLDADLEHEFLRWLRDRWDRKVGAWYLDDAGVLLRRKLNRRLPPDHVPAFRSPNREHGVVLVRGEQSGAYVAKMGLGKEAAQMTIKQTAGGHRTPLEILGDHYLRRDPRDAGLWIEWCQTMKGKVHLYWSKGLRERLLGDGERDDAEVACNPSDEVPNRYLCALEPRLVDRLSTEGWRFDSLVRDVCCACERWGTEALGPMLQAFLGPDEGAVRFDSDDRVYWWARPTDVRGCSWWVSADPFLDLSNRARESLLEQRGHTDPESRSRVEATAGKTVGLIQPGEVSSAVLWLPGIRTEGPS